jgi:hypothetical protein
MAAHDVSKRGRVTAEDPVDDVGLMLGDGHGQFTRGEPADCTYS